MALEQELLSEQATLGGDDEGCKRVESEGGERLRSPSHSTRQISHWRVSGSQVRTGMILPIESCRKILLGLAKCFPI